VWLSLPDRGLRAAPLVGSARVGSSGERCLIGRVRGVSKDASRPTCYCLFYETLSVVGTSVFARARGVRRERSRRVSTHLYFYTAME
jgi:hypothetical protein